MSSSSISSSSSSSPCEAQEKEALLKWSERQGGILTAKGGALQWYVPERGFPFSPDELPHHYLQEQTTHAVFAQWAKERNRVSEAASCICGAWTRPIFMGEWDFTTHVDEGVYNVQTNTLFVDIRIPTLKRKFLATKTTKDKSAKEVLESLTEDELRLYARQHAFAGYAVLCSTRQDRRCLEGGLAKDGASPPPAAACLEKYPLVCTRHHCIDWNYVGVGRPRPNKWYVLLQEEPAQDQPVFPLWKELSFATNEHGQHYYWEMWKGLEPKTSLSDEKQSLVMALRREPPSLSSSSSNQDQVVDLCTDGILVVVGDRFNYIRSTRKTLKDFPNLSPPELGRTENLGSLVDAALACGNKSLAVEFLGSIDAGHGRILRDKDSSTKWQLEACLQYWKEGQALFERHDVTLVRVSSDDGDGGLLWYIRWRGERWNVYESNCDDWGAVERLFGGSVQMG